MSFKRRDWRVFVPGMACLVGVVALWFLVARLLLPPQSGASDALRPLTFDSPIGNPVLNIVKTVDEDTPAPGDEIEYTLTYSTTNPDSQVFNVQLYDFLPAGVQYLGSHPPALSSDGALLFTHASLTDTNRTATIQVRVRDGYQQLYNRAIVMADGVDPAHDSLLTPLEQAPKSLRLSKTGDSAALDSGELVYRLRCENPDSLPAEGVTLVDVLPSGVSNVRASLPPDEVTFPALSWSLGDLPPGASRTIVVTMTAPSSAGVISNTVLADARDRVMTKTVFATKVITLGAILRLNKSGSAEEADVGDELLYTLRYENTGNQTATGVILTDTLPANVTVIDAGTATVAGGMVVWNVGDVISGTRGQVTVTVAIEGGRGATLHNQADMAGDAGFAGRADFYTAVRNAIIYLPLVMRDF